MPCKETPVTANSIAKIGRGSINYFRTPRSEWSELSGALECADLSAHSKEGFDSRLRSFGSGVRLINACSSGVAAYLFQLLRFAGMEGYDDYICACRKELVLDAFRDHVPNIVQRAIGFVQPSHLS